MGPPKPAAREMSATLCHCAISVMCLLLSSLCVALLQSSLYILDFNYWLHAIMHSHLCDEQILIFFLAFVFI